MKPDMNVKNIVLTVTKKPDYAVQLASYKREVSALCKCCPVCGKYNPQNTACSTDFDYEEPVVRECDCRYCGAEWKIEF